MDKLKMAHEYAMQHLNFSGHRITMASLLAFAWEYADEMQAEHEKRIAAEEQRKAKESEQFMNDVLKSSKNKKGYVLAQIEPVVDSFKTKPGRGDKYYDDISTIKVMAVCDGYVMARRLGCIPFVLSESDFFKKFKESE